MTLALWQALWDAFEARAAALDPSVQPADPVDRAIWWQLAGHATFTGPPRARLQLQLPEIHSGAPWLADRPRVAIMTLNPAFIADESFPLLDDRAVHGDEVLRRFFDERFESGRHQRTTWFTRAVVALRVEMLNRTHAIHAMLS